MWTRRSLLKNWLFASLVGSSVNLSILSNFISTSWARVKQLLPKGFSREELKNMNPAEVDSRDLDIDPLDTFETMGPTDVAVNIKTYRLNITGKVKQPLSLTYDEILKLPSLTETVLLICPGFFTNTGRWTGVSFRTLLQEAAVHQEANYLNVKGAYGKVVRIPLQDIDRKKVFLAYRVNSNPLPQKHGFPLRLVYEDTYGYDWVKYVDQVVIS
jgi:DMSO/TMAO reductase YedYZ molybdopterin-dependent catalytic subunit